MTPRKARLKRAILESLNRYAPLLEPQRVLFAEVNTDFSPAATTAEVEEALRELQEDRLIAGMTGGLAKEPRWKITDEGRLALAEG